MENKDSKELKENQTFSKENKANNSQLWVILLAGILIGALLKAQALKKITMGFEDYRLTNLESNYSFSESKKENSKEKNKKEKEEEQEQEQGKDENPKGNNKEENQLDNSKY